jgi:protein-tyrosine-phosphatase
MSKVVLFVCTGNMCRSPMAEYMMRARLPEGTPWSIASAGTMSGNGMDASANTVDVLREIGIDMAGHRTRSITEKMIEESAVIITMSHDHTEQLLDLVPAAKEKVFLMRSFDPDADTRDVPDPVGWDIDVYRGTREMLDGALPGLLAFIDQLEGA